MKSAITCKFCGVGGLSWAKVEGRHVLKDGAGAAHVCKARTCEKCRGTGTYGWGAVVNGKISHSGPCFRCNGTGRETARDFRRNLAYDSFAFRRALGL